MRGLEGSHPIAQSIESLIRQILANTIVDSPDISPETNANGTRLRIKRIATSKSEATGGTSLPGGSSVGDILMWNGQAWIALALNNGVGGILWFNGSEWVVLGAGSAGDVLRMGPTGPYWDTPQTCQ